MTYIADTFRRLSAQPPRRRIMFLLGMTLIYTLAFYPLHRLIAGSAITPSLLLVVLAATLFAVPGGLISGILVTLLNALLLLLVEGSDYGFMKRDFWFVHLAVLAIGVWVGHLEVLRSRLEAELAKRQHSDESLRESRQMLQLIMDHIPQAVFWKDRELNYLGCNREFAADAGLDSPEQIIGQNDFDMPWLDQAELYRVDDRRVLKSGQSKLNYEEPQTTPEGKQTWLRTSKVPMRNADGEVVAVLGMYEDITARKHTEEALTRHNQALQALQQGGLDIATELDVPTLLQRIMERAMALLDADRGGAVYLYDSEKNVLRLERGAGINRGREGVILQPGQGVMGVVLQTGESLIVNNYTAWEGHTNLLIPEPSSAVMGVPLLSKEKVVGALGLVADSSRRTFDAPDARLAEAFASQAAIALKNAQLYTAAQQEIAERKLAEEALQQSRERYRRLVELSPDAVLVHVDDRYVYANPAAVQLFGASSVDQILGMTYWERIHPDYQKIVHERVYKMREDGVGVPLLEEKIARFDGTIFDAEVAAVPITYEGQPAVQVIIRDVSQRKRMERDLRDAEQRYRALFERTHDAVFIMNLDSIQIEVNQKAADMLGYTVEELVGRHAQAFLDPEELEDARARERAVMAGEIMPVYERLYRRKDGSTFIGEINVALVHDDQGNPSHFHSVVRDITERKQMEVDLRESEARYRVITELSSDYAFAYDVQPDGTLVTDWVTATAEKITGIPPDQWHTSEYFRKRVHPDDLPIIEERMRKVLAGQQSREEYRLVKPDGEMVWLRSYARPVWDEEQGRVVRIYGAGQDITERKRMEEALRESEAYLTEAQRIGRIGNWVNNLETGKLYWSDQVFRIFGRERQDMTVAQVIDWVHPEDQERLAEAIETYMRENTRLNIEYRCVRPDGEVRALHVHGECVLDESGRLIKTVGTVQDITERKRMEEELRVSEERAREFQEKLKALHEISLELASIESIAELCTKAVELGRSGLGYDRIGILLFENAELSKVSRFGIESTGELRVEHGMDYDIETDKVISSVMTKRESIYVNEDAALGDFDTRVGRGWNVITGMWNDKEDIGWMAADNFFNQRPLIPYQIELLRLYGLTVSHLVARKRMDEELRASEGRYRQLFEGINDVIFVHDEDANILDVNEAACRQLGYTREELLQMKTSDIDAPSFALGFEDRLVRQLAEGGLRKITGVHVAKDGRHIFVDVNTKTITYQGKTAILAVVRDVTERRQMEEALIESQTGLTEAQRIGRIGNWVNYLDREELYWSDELFRIFGRERQEVTIDISLSWIHPDDRQRVREALEAYLRDNTRLDIEYRGVWPDGTIRHLHSQGEAVYNEAGEPVKTVGTVQDVTERRLAEERRLELKLERGRVNALRQFAGDISHDLMTPITTMKTGLYLLGRLKDSPEKQRVQLERLGNQIDQLQDRIQAMLNMMRLDATRAEDLEIRVVDMNAFAGQVAEVHRSLAVQKQQQLVFQACPRQATLVIEEALMSTALSHLIDNAMNHTPEYGTITLSIDCDDESVVIAVTDTGEGIDEESLPRIFERFYRKESYRPLSSGVGLGLPIARRIVELHGGTIDVESTPGQGSTFRIRLPKRAVRVLTGDNPPLQEGSDEPQS